MEVLEHLLEVQPALGPELVRRTNMLEWLLHRVGAPTFDANKLYASELLGVLVNSDSGIQSELGKLRSSSKRGNDSDEDVEGGIDLILRACAIYRRNSAEPKDGGEAEVRVCAPITRGDDDVANCHSLCLK